MKFSRLYRLFEESGFRISLCDPNVPRSLQPVAFNKAPGVSRSRTIPFGGAAKVFYLRCRDTSHIPWIVRWLYAGLRRVRLKRQTKRLWRLQGPVGVNKPCYAPNYGRSGRRVSVRIHRENLCFTVRQMSLVCSEVDIIFTPHSFSELERKQSAHRCVAPSLSVSYSTFKLS